jgi:ABC-type uncharacterized transport system YnjBCD ATPase subunit
MSTVLIKQPGETLPYAIDFTNLIPTGDSLSSVTSVTATPSGSGDLTLGSASISGTQVQFTIQGGIEGTMYRVEAIVVTTVGSILEGDGRLFVTDRT